MGPLLWNLGPCGSVVKSPPASAGAQVSSLDQEAPLGKEMAVYSSILPGKSYGQRSLVGYRLWGHKESETI